MKQINEQRVKKILQLMQENKGFIFLDDEHYRLQVQHPTKQMLDEVDFFGGIWMKPMRYNVENIEHRTLLHMEREGLIKRHETKFLTWWVLESWWTPD